MNDEDKDLELEEKIEKLHVDWLNTDGYKFYQFYNDIIQTVRKDTRRHMAKEMLGEIEKKTYVNRSRCLVIWESDIKDLLSKYTEGDA